MPDIALNSIMIMLTTILQGVICLIDSNSSIVITATVIFGLQGLLIGGPYGYLCSTELKIRTHTNREMYLAIILYKFSCEIMTFIFMLITGFLM